MLTGAEIAVGSNVLKGAWTGVKSLMTMLKDRKDAPILAAVAEIQQTLIEAQTAHGELVIAYQELQREYTELKASLVSVSNDYEHRDGVYWKKSDKDGPFCPPCLDSKHKPIRLSDDDRRFWVCQVCNNTFDTPHQREQNREAADRADEARRQRHRSYDSMP